MASRSTFPLVDRILGGTLVRRLTTWRRQGLSFDAISHELRDLGIDPPPTSETVRLWCREYAADLETDGVA